MTVALHSASSTVSPSRVSSYLPVAIPLPSKLFVPVPTSAESLPIGTHVARGKPLVATTDGLECVPIAPAEGTVAGMREVEVLGGRRSPAVVLDVTESAADAAVDKNDGTDDFPRPRNLADLIERLRLSGFHADRRTSPALLSQLHQAMQRPVDTVLCGLLDAAGGESPLSAALLRTRGEDLIAGLSALADACGAQRIWIAADPELARRAAVLARKAHRQPIRVVELANDYPQADPTLLLFAMLGRRLRPDRLPPEAGCILLDGPAAATIARSLARQPMTESMVELRDSVDGRSHLFTSAIGMPIRHLLAAAGLSLATPRTYRAGASLRDARLKSTDAVIGGHEILIDAGPISPPINPEPCIRCGWCVEACPVRIHPAALLEAAQESDATSAARLGLHACIECGICSYVCPSRLPILHGIRELRAGARSA